METVGLWQLAEEQQPYMTAMRRLFHTEPELSGREFKTRETLCKELTWWPALCVFRKSYGSAYIWYRRTISGMVPIQRSVVITLMAPA